MPVVLLHGFGLDARMWEPQFERFATRFRVIRYDLRGFGRSSLPSSESYSNEEDLESLLLHMDAAPAHVVGLSMGGRFALRFAAAFPEMVRSLVLADSALDGYTWSADWQMRWKSLCGSAKSGAIEEAKRQWLEHPLFDAARSLPSCRSLLSEMVADYSGWHWHNRDTANAPSPPVGERLGDLVIPALVIVGSRDLPDFQAIAERLSAELPLARRAMIEDAGHMVNLEASESFNKVVEEFWRELG